MDRGREVLKIRQFHGHHMLIVPYIILGNHTILSEVKKLLFIKKCYLNKLLNQ